MHRIDSQYTAGITPFVFIATIFGVAKILKRAKSYQGFSYQRNLIYSLSVFLLCCSLFSNYFFGRSPISYHFDKNNYQVTEHDRITRDILKLIPENAAVSADILFAPHLSQRERLTVFPRGIRLVDYILIDKTIERMP